MFSFLYCEILAQFRTNSVLFFWISHNFALNRFVPLQYQNFPLSNLLFAFVWILVTLLCSPGPVPRGRCWWYSAACRRGTRWGHSNRWSPGNRPTPLPKGFQVHCTQSPERGCSKMKIWYFFRRKTKNCPIQERRLLYV